MPTINVRPKLMPSGRLCRLLLAFFVSFTWAVRVYAASFSDANWVGMGGLPGADGGVSATVVDPSGNLYIGGSFTVVGEMKANHIAKWDGTNWAVLDSGVDGSVYALAVAGSDLYVGGAFNNAGGASATGIARWNGTTWSAVGSGLTGTVMALAINGADVYAGGKFTNAPAGITNIARWDGNSWSALGGGIGNTTNDFVAAIQRAGAGRDVGQR